MANRLCLLLDDTTMHTAGETTSTDTTTKRQWTMGSSSSRLLRGLILRETLNMTFVTPKMFHSGMDLRFLVYLCVDSVHADIKDDRFLPVTTFFTILSLSPALIDLTIGTIGSAKHGDTCGSLTDDAIEATYPRPVCRLRKLVVVRDDFGAYDYLIRTSCTTLRSVTLIDVCHEDASADKAASALRQCTKLSDLTILCFHPMPLSGIRIPRVLTCNFIPDQLDGMHELREMRLVLFNAVPILEDSIGILRRQCRCLQRMSILVYGPHYMHPEVTDPDGWKKLRDWCNLNRIQLSSESNWVIRT